MSQPINMDFELNTQSWQSEGLVFWMPFENGNTYEYINKSFGTVTGASRISDGYRGRGFRFANATANYIAVDSPISNPLSFVFWANPTSASQFRGIAGSLASGGSGWYINLETDAVFLRQINTSRTHTFTANGKPQFFVYTEDLNKNWVWYVDGRLGTSNTHTENLTWNNLGEIGRFWQNNSYSFDGDIYGFSIYNRVLSASEVLEFYQNPWELYKPIVPVLRTVTSITAGDTTWGHDTGVTETNIRDFTGNWTGTGTISGSGDSERLELESTEYMISEVINTGVNTVTLEQNKYGTGDTVTMDYRTGATSAACEAASWTSYTVPFASSGYAQIRLTSTL